MKNKRLFFASGLVVCVTGVASAQVYFEVPDTPFGMPKYFTGTNCRADAMARGEYDSTLGRTLKLKKLELLINGEFVKAVSSPIPTKNPLLVAAVFDSTAQAFQVAGGTIQFGARVTDELNRVHTQYSTSAPVKNKALYLREILPGSVDPVASFTSRMTSLGYSTSSLNNSTWTSSDGLDAVGGVSVMFETSHGDRTYHGTGDHATMDAYRPPSGQITGTRSFYYSEERRISIGNVPGSAMWPPYNASGNPPFNLVALDSCDSGGADPGGVHSPNSAFVELLFPYANRFTYNTTGQVENQAVIGWNGYALIGEEQKFVDAILGPMENGYTILEARDKIVEDQSLSIAFSSSGPWVKVSSQGHLPIYGDWYTRIKGAYSGNTNFRGQSSI